MVAITQEQMEAAFDTLTGSDETAAVLKTNAERAKFRAAAVKDAIFLRTEGTVAERQAEAAASKEYEQAQEQYFMCLEAAEQIKNERDTADLIIRAWQTVSSNRRQGGM